jgi:excisionase family DNA binding protein
MTVKEAAHRLNCSAETVYALCAAKLLRHSRIGLKRGRIFIAEEAIAEYLKQRERGGASMPTIIAPPPLKHLKL